MQMVCNLVSYAEKWVQVMPVDSPGVKLQLERKHVVLFVFVASEPGWAGDNPARRLHGKCHVRSPSPSSQRRPQLRGRAFTMFLSCLLLTLVGSCYR